uniref:Zinc finger MYM-type protein 1-like n=1 Tax=Nicotiana tabacum TaxID=4097 RepID=A0A1S4BJM3_TOBAC|nr:PREDICTED: zinc finger MYM-type protein 1-like [Nicotiana tabacum]
MVAGILIVMVTDLLMVACSSSPIATPVEQNLNQLEEQPQSSKRQRQGIDLDSLPTNPKERIPIRDYHPNERDEMRREYLRRGPCQPRHHKFPQRDFSGLKCRFNPKWFDEYRNWLEYSVIEDAAYCNPVKPSFRLKASIEVVRLLLNQGLTFRGHHEDESSLNKGNFLEILSWYAGRCNKIRDLVLKKAPKNDQLTSHKIQKDIIIAFDESCDVSRKEQLAIVLRYVNRCGSVVEHFIGIIHVRNTRALCLKEAIVDYIAQHSLSLSYVHGQCYDGASNMQGDFRGLKTLIQQESKSAYSIHCFAHQLQLTLVAVSKKYLEVGELVLLVSNILNIVGGSFKRMDDLRES